MKYFRSYLGGAKFVPVIAKSHPRDMGAWFFDGEEIFGDATDAANAAVSRGAPFIGINLTWSDSDHKYDDSFIPRIEARAKKWQAWKKRNPTIVVYLSTLTEHKLATPDKYNDIAAKHAPDCLIVNNPLDSGALSTKYRNKFHGATKKPRKSKTPILFDFDGTNLKDSDVTQYKIDYKDAECFGGWIPPDNGQKKVQETDKNHKPIKIPRPKRKAYTTVEQNQSAIYVLRNDKGITKCPEDSIFKSDSDQQTDIPGPRDNKPTLITPDKGNEIVFKMANGKVLCKAAKGDKFKETRPKGKPARYIYRISEWGYKLSQKAKKESGSPIVSVVVNGKEIGKLHLAFRDGVYRE